MHIQQSLLFKLSFLNGVVLSGAVLTIALSKKATLACSSSASYKQSELQGRSSN
jgi:hypothetical protein